MITSEQEKWLSHLSNKDKIKIIPFDQTAEEKFQRVKQRIQKILGEQTRIEHHGATSLGISGQDEIDIYIPISPNRFNPFINSLKTIFGEPRSLYKLERARFVTQEDNKHIDIFLINEECNAWKNGIKFEEYLHSHPESLEEYRQLKEKGNGSSVQEYYRKKTEFINRILKM
jgi:GrpB-like predicted nucleotidyltransferase (UPF0157 family)